MTRDGLMSRESEMETEREREGEGMRVRLRSVSIRIFLALLLVAVDGVVRGGQRVTFDPGTSSISTLLAGKKSV